MESSREKQGRQRSTSCLILTTIDYVAEFAGGITLMVHQHEVWIVNGLCYVIFASFIIALNRAWALIKSEIALPTSS